MRRTVAGAALCITLGLLAACGDDGSASPTALSSDGPSATATYPTGANGPILACSGLDRPVSGAAATSAASAKGRALPNLTLDCLGGGKPVTLRDLRGPLLLNVWASWCGPCRAEQPYLSAAHATLGSRVRFVGLAMKDDDGPSREWLSFHGVDWPSLADNKGSIRGPLQVPGPPVTLFVNSAGQIVGVHYGQFTSARQVQDAIAEHLGVT